MEGGLWFQRDPCAPRGEGDGVSFWLQNGNPSDPISLEGIDQRTRWEQFLDYIIIGFEHIVPKGLDHILFVIGIFLLSTHWKPLLTQVTAFTIAHSITLGLSIYGIVQLPSNIVEPLIAASIVYVGIENLFTHKTSEMARHSRLRLRAPSWLGLCQCPF